MGGFLFRGFLTFLEGASGDCFALGFMRALTPEERGSMDWDWVGLAEGKGGEAKTGRGRVGVADGLGILDAGGRVDGPGSGSRDKGRDGTGFGTRVTSGSGMELVSKESS